MLREQAVRTRLRAATAGAHRRVDDTFSRFDLTCPEAYALFLQAQAAALLPLERALEAGASRRLPADWPARRRGQALLADLRALGVPEPVCDELAPIRQDAAALGTLYVLEGSRLGGAMLRRAVPAAGAAAAQPARGSPTQRQGHAAEMRAAHHLETQGVRILAANLRCRAGEIDLVAREGALLRALKGDVVTTVAAHLPGDIPLLIHA